MPHLSAHPYPCRAPRVPASSLCPPVPAAGGGVQALGGRRAPGHPAHPSSGSQRPGLSGRHGHLWEEGPHVPGCPKKVNPLRAFSSLPPHGLAQSLAGLLLAMGEQPPLAMKFQSRFFSFPFFFFQSRFFQPLVCVLEQVPLECRSQHGAWHVEVLNMCLQVKRTPGPQPQPRGEPSPR